MIPLKTIRRPWPWLMLFAASLLMACLLQRFAFPAAFLVGPMLVSLLFSLRGVSLRLPRKCFWGAQALIGCIVARTVTVSVASSIAHDWPSMLMIVGTTVLAGGVVGWVVMKSRTLPGSTAAWGSAPGGASAMISMAESYGADVRLVAFMQYLRVLVVVMSASIAAHFLRGELPAELILPAVMQGPGASTFWSMVGALVLAACGGWVGYRLRIPAGIMLVPMLAGAVLQAGTGADFALPEWLQAIAYMVLGWYVGLGFDRSILRYTLRAFPILLLATFLLIALCAGSAWMLTHVLHTDPLTAYLATSPGGLDSIAIIALGSQADIPFVLAVQTLRLFMVILTGPWIARLICHYAK